MYMTKMAAISAAALLLAGCEAQQAQYISKPPGPDQKIILKWDGNAWKVKLSDTGPEEDPAKAITKLNKDDGPSKFEVHIAGHPTATFKDPGGLDAWEGPNMKNHPKTGINSNHILGPVVTNNKTLVFWFLNPPTTVTVNYRLNFNNGVPSVDPIIEN